MDATSRPVWGCLDAQEIREAAAGRTEDPVIHEHLSRCGQCRQLVQELRGDLRRSRRSGGSPHRRSGLGRAVLWLLLVALVLAALAWWFLFPSPRPRPAPTPASAPPPAAAPAEPPPAASPPKRPSVRRAAPRRRNGPDDAAIVAVIRSNQTGVKMCYERALRIDPRLSVRLDVRVGVSAAGVPETVSLDGIRDGAPLAACIRDVIKTWTFPRAAVGYETAFPLRLQQSVGL